MSKKNKIVLGTIVAVLVIAIVGLASQTGLLQGRLSRNTKLVQVDPSIYYRFFGKTVSPVTSPVPSVVVSNVPSIVVTAIPTIVVSKVPSVVVSAVTSAVAASNSVASQLDSSKLPQLTQDMLKDIAKNDYKKNPGKFTLSNAEKQKILNLYEQKKARK